MPGSALTRRLVCSKDSSKCEEDTSLNISASSPSRTETGGRFGNAGTSDMSGSIKSNGKYGAASELDNATDDGGKFRRVRSSSPNGR